VLRKGNPVGEGKETAEACNFIGRLKPSRGVQMGGGKGNGIKGRGGARANITSSKKAGKLVQGVNEGKGRK